MHEPHPDFTDEELLRRVMRRQAALGLKIASVFLLLLIGLPLANERWPKLMATQIGGFTLSWLILGVLFFPITWLLSMAFVSRSEKIEHELAAEYQEKGA